MIHVHQPEMVGEEMSPERDRGRLTLFLRAAGILLILFSALGFMLQGYAEIRPEYRYWVGLGLTLAMAAGGAVCACLWREMAGSRIFLALAILFVTVQVSQVGAMWYGWLQPMASLQVDAAWLRFSGVQLAVIVLDTLVTAAVAAVVSYGGFAVLARRRRMTLMRGFLVASAALWLPSRHVVWMALAVVGLYFWLRRLELQLSRDFSLQTWEGRAARALMFLPWLILAGRGWLHGFDLLYAAALQALGVFLLLWEVKRYTGHPWLVTAAEWTALLLAGGVWLMLELSFDGLTGRLALDWLLLMLTWLALSTRVRHGGSLARALSGLALLGGLGAMDEGGSGLTLLVGGVIWTAVAIQRREKLTLLPGVLGLVLGAGAYLEALADLYVRTPWVSSAVLGFLVLLTASWLEKQQPALCKRLRCYLTRWREW